MMLPERKDAVPSHEPHIHTLQYTTLHSPIHTYDPFFPSSLPFTDIARSQMIFVFACSFVRRRHTAKGHQREEREDVCENDIVVGIPRCVEKGVRRVGRINGEMREMPGAAVSGLGLGGHCHARPRIQTEPPLVEGEPDQKTRVHAQEKGVHG